MVPLSLNRTNLHLRVPQISQKPSSHLQILGVRTVKLKFHNDNPQFWSDLWTPLLSGTFYLVHVNFNSYAYNIQWQHIKFSCHRFVPPSVPGNINTTHVTHTHIYRNNHIVMYAPIRMYNFPQLCQKVKLQVHVIGTINGIPYQYLSSACKGLYTHS